MMILVILLLVYLLIEYRGGNRNQSTSADQSVSNKNQALDILNQRYAAGEIDDEEYSRRKTILKD
ncbi:MAG: SHOCT domain-containing protein [Atopostipes suicloacalis]|nr:SHOCT domain-containing protein [Atopostipes suicloacalis]MDN6731287.1 SHOCT domain-containing protein [Atopostipes suicloacalis]